MPDQLTTAQKRAIRLAKEVDCGVVFSTDTDMMQELLDMGLVEIRPVLTDKGWEVPLD